MLLIMYILLNELLYIDTIILLPLHIKARYQFGICPSFLILLSLTNVQIIIF